MTRRFPWQRTAEVLDDLAAVATLSVATAGRIVAHAVGGDRLATVAVPPCLPPIDRDADVADWRAALPDALGCEVLVLVQAGAAALGLWRDDDEVLHRVLKRYVIRGNGKAQPTHLKTRGKSRYGSRLRLQNHRRQLDEINELLAAWDLAEGPFDVIWRSCVDRSWAELCAHDPAPPFEARDPRIRRVPLHVHTPGLEELRRVRRELTSGRVEIAPGS